MRTSDIVARYGGDEIVLFLNNFTDRDKLRNRIERIRDDIANTVISADGISLSVTASFGVYVKYNETLTLEEVIKRADEIMYLSKNGGKNKVTIR
jgi:diguanylate cyclase (GGDEF)-like protein